MRLLITAGVVVFTAGAAFGAYLIELDGGDRMTVDSDWEAGGRMYLSRGGVDMSVPRSHVRSVHEVSGADEAGVKPALPPAAPAGTGGRRSGAARTETERDEVRIARHVVKVNKELSIARTRGDSRARVKHLERELRHTESRWRDVKGELGIR
jgi:hypothetical protein